MNDTFVIAGCLVIFGAAILAVTSIPEHWRPSHLAYKASSWFARRTGYAEDLYDVGWRDGYDDAVDDIEGLHPQWCNR
jgi:hypothetical protein